MEFILGALTQYPFPSTKYKNGYQIKTIHPIVISPNEIKTVKSNIFIKHANDCHLRLFITEQFQSNIKLMTYWMKSQQTQFEYTIMNISNNEINVPADTHLIDVIWTDDITDMVYLLENTNINTLSLDGNNITNHNSDNKPLSLNDINNN